MDLLTTVERDTGAVFEVTSTGKDGPEHTGPCPFCRVGDDRFHVWPEHSSGKARYWCRVCDESGDHVDYLMATRNMRFVEASKETGLDIGPAQRQRQRQKQHQEQHEKHGHGPVSPPSEKWQHAARLYVRLTQQKLWSDGGKGALSYLMGTRGLHEETIRRFGLGYNPKGHNQPGTAWGLDGQKVWCAMGVTIPCEIDGVLWYVKTRRPVLGGDGHPDALARALSHKVSFATDKKYFAVKGGVANAMYGADDLTSDGRPLLVCEGEFDAMLAWQELRDLCDVCTLGASKGKGGIPAQWRLSLLPYDLILVAYDVDGNGAGDKYAAGLLEQSRRAHRIKVPMRCDLTDYHNIGGDLRAWLALQLAMLETEAKERMRAGAEATNTGVEKIPHPESEQGKSRDHAATLFNTNARECEQEHVIYEAVPLDGLGDYLKREGLRVVSSAWPDRAAAPVAHVQETASR